MKIVELKTWVVGNPPPHFGGRYFIFLQITTDTGLQGLGEVYAATFGPETIVRMIEDVFARRVLDRDPFQIEKLWRDIYSSGYSQRPDPSLIGVLSGIEMACWDIVGKELGRPVYDLLGGRVRERLRSYTYIYPDAGEGAEFYQDPDRSAVKALEYVDAGFTALKFDPAGPYTIWDGRQPELDAIDRSVEFLRKIREKVGTRADLLFGTHGQFTPSGAIRLARQLEPWDPLWFEEPTPPENPDGMAQVARQTSIPIATGERLTTKYEFARVLQAGAASILQMALGRVGGILEGKKIASMAETYHAQIAPHLYCGPVAGAAGIQLATCTPNFLVLEGIERWDGFHAEILKTPIQWEEGYVIPPTAPGLGIEIDEDVAAAHPYTGDALHLEMAD
ncbi:MAG: mandelate racemase/muconate lactonizing enzyme family protein [Candidatus Binatia bacterium]|nr:mandelate racemase/muconate lactonizing enzyme family protein [Candidatus Binatia bacterium]MDG1957361.1 mandelate racemase/muconate lactonizing enzyme family protein [Candidatus Binatia bacterium]MDG2011399.1 mandelate racemase/muconate lactonizing enzyme family protein [Candidatus Binatia bacterium]HAC79690.1 isomerase [Deltaproteobacteria bacterium]